MSFEAFMKQNLKEEKVVEIIASKRIIDSNGTPIPWKIKSITSKQDDDLRKQFTKLKSGRKKDDDVFDVNGYLAELAVRCTVYPDLHNKELQDSYGVMGARELLGEMLKPGEFARFVDEIQRINGFYEDINDLVEEAKN